MFRLVWGEEQLIQVLMVLYFSQKISFFDSVPVVNETFTREDEGKLTHTSRFKT